MAFTTTDLIASIKSRAQIPSSQNTFMPVDLLRFADEEIQIGLVPLILSVRESYYQAYVDLPVTSGVSSYPIPSRAIGEKLRHVVVIDNNQNKMRLDRIEVEQVAEFNPAALNRSNAYYIENNSVVLVPTPNTTDGSVVRLYYFMRPGSLILPSAALQVASVSGSSIITTSPIPSTWGPTGQYDVIRVQPGFDCLVASSTVSGIGGNTLTLSSPVPSSVSPGDWVTIAGQSPVPQVPVELHPVLAQRVAIRVLSALGQKSEVDIKTAELKEMMSNAFILLNPRVDSGVKKITPRYTTLFPNGGYENWILK